MSDPCRPCQSTVCAVTPDVDIGNLEGIPSTPLVPVAPAVPPYSNGVVYYQMDCEEGDTINYSGTLPSWITLDEDNNRLVGAAGLFRGNSPALANAAAQSALNTFGDAAVEAGTLTCGLPCPSITWVNSADITQGIGSNSQTLSDCELIAEGTAGTGAPNIAQGSLFDYEAYFHYTNSTGAVQTITIAGPYSIHAEYPSSPAGFAECTLYMRAADFPSNVQIELFTVDEFFNQVSPGTATSSGNANFIIPINPGQTISFEFWLIQQVQSNAGAPIVVGLATGSIDFVISIA